MPLYIAKSRDLEGCHACLTDSQRKDRATQLLTKYKSGALVTQNQLFGRFSHCNYNVIVKLQMGSNATFIGL